MIPKEKLHICVVLLNFRTGMVIICDQAAKVVLLYRFRGKYLEKKTANAGISHPLTTKCIPCKLLAKSVPKQSQFIIFQFIMQVYI